MRVAGVGCCVLDLLYEVPPGQDPLRRWLARSPGDGGIIRGGAVLKSALERRFGVPVDAWISEVLPEVVPRRTLGGVSIVALITAAQLLRDEASVRLHGCLSDDADGQWIARQIGRTPVGLDKLLRRHGRCPTTLCLNERHADGTRERSFVAEPCIPEPLALDPTDLDPEFFGADVAVFCCMHWEPKLFARLASVTAACKRAGAVTVMGLAFDPSRAAHPDRWPIGDSDEVYRHVDVLAMDRTEALRYSGERELEPALAFFRRSGVGAFAVTDGVEPVLYWSGGSACAAAEGALPIPAAIDEDKARGVLPTGDSVGCGDNFVGGVIASVAMQRRQGRRLDLVEAVKLGNLCGGLTSTHAGGPFFESQPGEKRALIERYAVRYDAQLRARGTRDRARRAR